MKKFKITVKVTKLLADLQTPIGVYLKVRDIYPESALLESSDYNSKENSYTFIGVDPIARFKVERGEIAKVYPDQSMVVEKLNVTDNLPIKFQSFIKDFELTNKTEERFNGFYGYTSYDAIRYFNGISPDNVMTSCGDVPEFYYLLYRFTLAFDHLKNELSIIENVLEGEKEMTSELVGILTNNNYASYNFSTEGSEVSNLTDDEHREMIKKGIAHCKAGDVTQIVLSRSFTQKFTGDDFKVYRALRSINPSPYLFYFDFGSFRVFGSSPETHCSIHNGIAQIDPIAGTYFRTGDYEMDRKLAEKLLKDEKENSEHDMLVDLAVSDLSLNCDSVKVDFYKHVQYYSHVLHLVSRVTGKLKAGKNSIAVYAETFPAGTLTGAPKPRALELIRDIEKQMRGVYGGCIGYIGFNGELTQAITIRTFLSKENTLYYQAGGGIVEQSNIENEVQEVKNKLGALTKAVQMATNLIN